ncbi:MAG: STAS domain-containing protein [Magnetococcales bacterium]|nr:STAS domain-containing protein [Magnetococcales bacterium]
MSEGGHQIRTEKTDEGFILRIDTDKFNFSCHHSFRSSYKDIPPGTSIKVDFSKVNYMDSSALGMLLLLREHLGKEKSVTFINCKESIRNIFAVANFQELFIL